MKKTRYWFLAALTVLLIVGLTAGAFAYETGRNGRIDWTLDDSGVLSFSGEGVLNYWELEATRSAVRLVVILDGITGIDNAFSDCPNLEEILISDSVTSIGPYSFNGCAKLKSIDLPETLTDIQNHAFYGCTGLERISLPQGVTAIEPYAFCGCTSLTQIGIPDSVTEIKNHAFSHCSALKTVSLPDSVTGIWNAAFEHCTALEHINIPSGVDTIEEETFSCCTGLKSFVIPNTVTTLGAGAFLNCTGIGEITIPDSIIQNDGAFENCSATLYTKVFSDVSYLLPAFSDPDYPGIIFMYGDVRIERHSPDGLWSESLLDTGLVVCGAKKDVENAVLPHGVLGIDEYAFSDCTALRSATLPETLLSIGKKAFFGCSSLTGLTLPPSVVFIGAGAFTGCSALANINIPNGVTAILDSTFSGCYALSDISIPSSVILYEQFAFDGCVRVSGFYLSDEARIENSSFQLTAVLYAKIGSRAAKSVSAAIYEYVTPTRNYTFRDPDSPDLILQYQGEDQQILTLLEADRQITDGHLPDGITCIGEGALDFCYELTDVILPEGVTAIEANAFQGCSGLKGITIPDSIAQISTEAFSGCSAVLWAPFDSPASKTLSAAGYSFRDPTYPELGFRYTGEGREMLIVTEADQTIQDFALPEAASVIGKDVFSRCPNLREITIPDSVTEIGEGAFRNCISLTAVTFPRDIAQIGADAFTSSGFPVVYCYTATYAENWAREQGYRVVLLDRVPGNADGDENVDIQDALLVLQFVSGLEPDLRASAADVNGDGEADLSDAMLILQADCGWDVTLQ